MSFRLVLTAALLLLAGCASQPMAGGAADREPDEGADHDPLLAKTGVPHRVVAEAFVTAATPEDNIDSPAAWTTKDGKVWLLATAKAGERLVIYDGDSGATLRTFGTAGQGPGQFKRANGIFVHRDLAFVVERDNHRVQVLALPSLRSLATFGDKDLVQPYGIWLQETQPGRLDVLVTDAYMAGEDAAGEDVVPPLADLGRRIQRYAVRVDGESVSAEHVGAFGDTGEAGAIRIPESVWGDPANDRLLVSEEDTATGTALREYDLDGKFRGRTIGLGLFKAQAEGIALWTCADGSGYWLATDQFKDRSLFHVFDRRTLQHLGAFAGRQVGNTDGVWLHQAGGARFPKGVFYAVHDDMAVGAFDWRDVAKALSLREDCSTG